MTKRRLGDKTIECVSGDITRQDDLAAVVNAANAELRPGGGVAGAIHRAAGAELDRECRPLAPLAPGQAVITGAHDLPNEAVIHVLGPVYGVDKPEAQVLSACYYNALRLAEEHGLASVGFPAISTGAFGYPLEPAARTAMETVILHLPKLTKVALVRFVLFGDSDRRVHAEMLESLLDGAGETMN